jgi:hypothetical protein
VIDSLQLSAKYPVATPADWQQGEEVMIAPRVSNEEADKLVGAEMLGWLEGWEGCLMLGLRAGGCWRESCGMVWQRRR